MLAKKGLMTAPAAVAQYVEDVFSTYVYSGNGTTSNPITNNIDISGEGGLLWIKRRNDTTDHNLYDTVRGNSKLLSSNLTDAESTSTRLTFGTSGFTLTNDAAATNASGGTYASWTFRKAEKFFDVVTYTGNGTTQAINHNLGSTPGCIIIKKTSSASSDGWIVFHRSLTASYRLLLNSTSARSSAQEESWFGNNSTSVAPTSTQFTVGSKSDVNGSGETYVAYLFAHDAGGFGDAGDQSVIKCGSYTGNGSATGPTITLDWEPQWVLIKQSTQSGTRWTVTDNMRGFPASSSGQNILQPHVTAAEVGVAYIQPTSTGFKVVDTDADVNTSGETYVYIAIRRGPMKTPTSGTDVFKPVFGTGNDPSFTSSWPVDASILLYPTGGNANYQEFNARLIGENRLVTSSTAAESANGSLTWDYSNGICDTAFTSSFVANLFRRAPGFFDVVCYTGTGSAGATTSHNLGVAPELIITRIRNYTGEDWIVHYRNGSTITAGVLNSTAAFANSSTAPSTDLTNFTSTTYERNTGNRRVNGSYNYVAYLFASVTGVSKVGSYTGTGVDGLQINCGFTAGARFVLIKRTDSANDWHVFDSARGIVSGNDPYLKLNTTGAEVTTDDIVDTYSSGFIVNAYNGVNANGGSYIYLAIA